MSDEKDPESPATTSLAYDIMFPKWVKIQTVLNGTEAMRDAGQLYLPIHDEESQNAYGERLHRNVLLNMSALTLDSWVGRPFSDPVLLNEDVPEQIKELTDNIDLLGNDINVFARDWFKDGMAKAISHVLVDMPRPRDTEAEEGRQRTLQDDREENLRPYWVHISPEELIFSHAAVVDGAEVLTEIRILEENIEQVGFAEVVTPRIRRIYLASIPQEDETFVEQMVVEIYELQRPRDKRRKKPVWVMIENWITDLDFIPLVTFYSDRKDFMIGKPPLEDLVDLNVGWWQSNSDQRAVLTVARFPMLALSGGTDDNNSLRVGPHEWLYTPDAAGKFYYVEHSGKAIEAGRKDLLDTEEQMSEYGAEFLKKRPGNLTATARALDSAEATSPLQDATQRFIDAMNTALKYTALWLGQDEGGSVTVTTEFGPEDPNGDDMNTLRESRKNRDLSRETYLEELKRRGLLSDDFDIQAELGRLEQEALSFAGPLGDLDDDDDDEETEEERAAREAEEEQEREAGQGET